MSGNKRTIEEYLDGFRAGDHEKILSCLTDDVEWIIPGFFQVQGRAAFDKEIENDAFVGLPEIGMTRLSEENDVVIAEGTVRAEKRTGGFLEAVFCDVFELRSEKIARLTTYQVNLKE